MKDLAAALKHVALMLALAVLCVSLLAFGLSAYARETLPRCGLPVPALVVVLPDGTEIPSAELTYQLAARRVVITGDARVFCGNFESF